MEKPQQIANLDSFYKINFIKSDKEVNNHLREPWYYQNNNGDIMSLSLANQQITDIQPLSKLPGITRLFLSGNKIENISSLSKLSKLRQLDLYDNAIQDVSPLYNLKELQALNLASNLLTEITLLDNLEELKTLNLSYNKITSIEGISTLTALVTLSLDGNEIPNLGPIKELMALGMLSLNNCGISTLTFLRKNTELKNLQLENNEITDITELHRLKYLKHINLSFNRISDLSPISALKHLRTVEIESNQITDLSPLFRMFADETIYEKSVNTKNNPWSNPPQEIVQSGVPAILDWLDDSYHQAREIIKQNLYLKDEYLDLGNCNLTDLSLIPELFECTHLKTLILSNEWGMLTENDFVRLESANVGPKNNIFNIPAAIAKLTSLEVLICGGDWKVRTENGIFWNRGRINKITEIAKLKALKFLNLSNNIIKVLYGINNLPELKTLYLNNNEIDFSATSIKLTSVEELYISNNKLRKIDFLLNMPNLKTADLHSNFITSLLPLKALLEKVDVKDTKWTPGVIGIADNPLNVPQPEIIRQGNRSIIAYLDQYMAEQKIKIPAYINRDIKLVLVGNSGSGKSTLSHWLRYNKVKLDIPSTHWLQIDKWDASDNGLAYNIRIFDFGGQEYYHDTHHLFFSQHTAYLLLWTEKGDNFEEQEVDQIDSTGKRGPVMVQNYPLNYWLDSIQFHTKRRKVSEMERKVGNYLDKRDFEVNQAIAQGRSWTQYILEMAGKDLLLEMNDQLNILIAQNKIDDTVGQKFINNQAIQKKYPLVYDFASLSVTKEIRTSIFRSILFEMLQKMPIMDKELLGTWGYIKTHIENNESDYLKEFSLADFRIFCNDLIKKIPQTKNRNSKKLNDILFSEIDSFTLANYLNDIGLLLFFPDNANLSDKVFINQKQILRHMYVVLKGLESKNGEFSSADVANTLPLLTEENHIDLLELMRHFKIIFRHPSKNTSFIAPLYLPKKPKKSIEFFLGLFKSPVLKFEFDGYIHKNIILEFFQEFGSQTLSDDEEDKSYLYWREGIILKDGSSEEIVMVKFCQGYAQEMYASIEIYVMNDMSSSTFREKIVAGLDKICRDHSYLKTVTKDGINYVPINIILKAETEKNWVFFYKNKNYNLTDFKSHLKNKLDMKNIFISYSKTDAAHLQKLENHLSVLKRTGKINTWNCRKLLPGEKWDGKIRHELEEADLILFLVSDDFLATDYIWDIEIKRAIEREELDGDVKVVPIVVRSCDWEESPLGIYNTAPRKAQVISTSEDIDVAWTSVVKELKAIL